MRIHAGAARLIAITPFLDFLFPIGPPGGRKSVAEARHLR
jgi:hypothetical protein